MENENKNIIVGDDGSYFDGGYWAYIGYNIAVAFVTGITFGIAHPWMKCWYQKWLASHTVINGKRMTFDGNGGDLFVKYIIWLILSYLTCGIYGLWMNVALKKWISEHTHFEGEPDNNSFFDGGVGDYFVTSILSALALFVPFAGPAWSKIIITRWFVNHTVIDSRRLTFRGTVGDLFIKYLLWGLLTSITCGIFAWFVPVKYIKWETEHTLDENCTPEALNIKANYKTQVHTDAVMLQSGDIAQLDSIKAQMLSEANEGIENNNLVKLEGALRFYDILKECGSEFTIEDEALIYNCTILARKLKAEKPVQTKSKLWLIIVAAVVAFLMFIGVVGGAIAAMAILGMRMPIMDRPAQQTAVVCNMTYSDFTQALSDAESEIGHIATRTMKYDDYDGAFKENYMVKCKTGGLGVGYFITVSVKSGQVDYIEVSGLKQGVDNISKMTQMVRYLYEEIGLGYQSDIIVSTESGYSSNTYNNWSFTYDNTDEAFNAKLDNTMN